MTPIRLVDGLPQRGEQPVVLVAAEWPAEVALPQVRTLARDWAALGMTGLVSDDGVVVDAARRAGLLAVVSAAVDAPHLLAASPGLARVASLPEAWRAALAGERFILGAFDDVAGLATFLLLADAAEPWQALPNQGDWCLARAGELVAAFSAEGGDVEVAVAAGHSVHWFDPASGVTRAVATPEPGDAQVVRGEPGQPLALLLAPCRFEPVEVDAADDL